MPAGPLLPGAGAKRGDDGGRPGGAPISIAVSPSAAGAQGGQGGQQPLWRRAMSAVGITSVTRAALAGTGKRKLQPSMHVGAQRALLWGMGGGEGRASGWERVSRHGWA